MSNPDFIGCFNAKLLLTGEYLVLQGATALAVPLQYGQKLEVSYTDSGFLDWNAISHNGNSWFSAKYSLADYNIIEASDGAVAFHPQKLLKSAQELNPSFFKSIKGCKITTTLNYPIEWGLGSSSTLIAAIATWAKVNPFDLHFSVSAGSGYDIACALSNLPLLYTLNQKNPSYHSVAFNPNYSDRIFFAYQGVKMDSAQSIKDFIKKDTSPHGDHIEQASLLTHSMLNASSLHDFETVMRKHEALISELINQPSIKYTRFADLPGEAKSLGAWGGDFCMITWNDDQGKLPAYLMERGFNIFFKFSNIVLLQTK